MRRNAVIARKSLLAALAAGLVLCAWPGGASAQTRSLAELATDQSPARAERLIAGARREGSVSFYSSLVSEDTTPVIAAFKRKYPIDVEVWRGANDAIVQRAWTERRAGRCPADAILAGPPAQGPLRREGLLQAVQSPVAANVMPQARPARGEYVGVYLDLFAAAINTNLVKADEVPKSYQDLTSPRWKGRLAVEADGAPWFAALMSRMGEAQGLPLFKEIVAKNGVSIRKGHTLLANLVAAGDVPLALTVYGYKSDQLAHQGAPIRTIYLPPVVALATAISVTRCAPHPNAALLLRDFLVSDAQEILAKRDLVPTDPRAGPLPAGIAIDDLTLMDPDQMLDQGARWTELWNNIALKPQ
jgi:iron(III) transport system substrate-binding protein